MLGLIIPWWGRALAVVAVLVAAAAFGAVKMHEYDESRYDALQAQFSTFQDKVRVEGLEAQARAKAQAKADLERKNDADKQNSDALATLASTVARLRADASRRPMPATPACSSDPQGTARYRVEFERAYGDLVSGVRAEAQQRCDPNRIGLNAAKGWAQKP